MTISLFIILLAFFILLNAIAVPDEKKKRVLVGSLIDSFGGESETAPRGEFADEDMSEGISPLDLSDLSAEKSKGMKDIRVTVKNKRTVLSIPDDHLFESGKTVLTPDGKQLLSNLVPLIDKNPYAMDISTHTDDRPVLEQTGMTNVEFTMMRSLTVFKYFTEQSGVPAERLTACGWGGEKPLEPNSTIETRKINRRLDLTFVHDNVKEKPKGFMLFKDFFFRVKEKGM